MPHASRSRCLERHCRILEDRDELRGWMLMGDIGERWYGLTVADLQIQCPQCMNLNRRAEASDSESNSIPELLAILRSVECDLRK